MSPLHEFHASKHSPHLKSCVKGNDHEKQRHPVNCRRLLIDWQTSVIGAHFSLS